MGHEMRGETPSQCLFQRRFRNLDNGEGQLVFPDQRPLSVGQIEIQSLLFTFASSPIAGMKQLDGLHVAEQHALHLYFPANPARCLACPLLVERPGTRFPIVASHLSRTDDCKPACISGTLENRLAISRFPSKGTTAMRVTGLGADCEASWEAIQGIF